MTKICETILLESQQTGRKVEDILVGARQMDNVGYRAIEIMPLPLTENSWESLTKLNQALKSTPMLVSLDVDLIEAKTLEQLVELGSTGGVDIFRVHAETNETDKMKRAVGAVTKAGKHAEGTLFCAKNMSVDFLTDLARKLKDCGCGSLCIYDSQGILGPKETTELLGLLKKKVDLPIALKFSSPSGIAEIAYYAAAGMGVDALYCLLSPITGRGSLPQTKTIVRVLADTDWSTDVRTEKLDEVARHFEMGSIHGPRAYDVLVSGTQYHVTVCPSEMGKEILPDSRVHGRPSLARAKSAPKKAPPTPILPKRKTVSTAKPPEKQAAGQTKSVRSTMEGAILDVLVKEGDKVERGTKLLILEAMKMQNQVLSPFSGTITQVLVKTGETVRDGQNLVTITI
ncbi:MAG: biotin/lipoyl-containing protein [Desulfatiglans sp.]|jgi:pyruvate carboxylase|nr:biotin/lipoyl-containing protein [Desulfatiglans sp.]